MNDNTCALQKEILELLSRHMEVLTKAITAIMIITIIVNTAPPPPPPPPPHAKTSNSQAPT